MEKKNTFTPEKKRETIESIINFIAEQFKEDIKGFKTINATGLLMRSVLYDTIQIVNERFTDKNTSLMAKEEISLTKELRINRKQEDGKMENQLVKTNIAIENTNLTPIEIALGVDEDGRTTSKRLYDFLGLDKKNYARWCKSKIDDNEFALENVDYMPFVINEECGGQATTDYKLTATFAKKLAMGTHNKQGEAAKNYFVKVEDRLKQQSIAISELSPSLQMFKKIFDSVAKQEIEHKQLQEEIIKTKEEAAAVKQEVQSMRDVIALNPNSWRSEVSNLLNKMAKQRGGTQEAYKEVRDESYKLLNDRAATKLEIRLTNRRRKVLEETGSKSRADKVSKLDVIADDKRLTEVYIAIVKEMAIKYKVA